MRILHFEYSDFFRRMIHDMTVRQGYDYIGTSEGKSLFKWLSQTDIDVILTGMELSDMSVETLLAELSHTKYKHIPVVIITSTDVQGIQSRLKGLQYADFLLKENLTLASLSKCLTRVKHL